MTGPIVLQRTITNTFNETRLDAQYVGDLNNLGAFDIALTGSLVPRDKGDYYSFRVTTGDTNVLLTTVEQTGGSSSTNGSTSSTSKSQNLSALVANGQVRYQLLSQTGQVIADSDPSSGKAYAAFQAFTSGKNLPLPEGTYTVKVSPGPNAIPNTTYDYIFTLRAGRSPVSPSSPVTDSEEFQTTADAATANTDESVSGAWLPTVLSPSSTSTSLFDTLDVYDGGSFAAGEQSPSSSSPTVPLESDTLLGGVVDLSG
jgi:hypothetical protein